MLLQANIQQALEKKPMSNALTDHGNPNSAFAFSKITPASTIKENNH